MVKKGFESNPFYSSSILIQMNEEKKKVKLITLSRVSMFTNCLARTINKRKKKIHIYIHTHCTRRDRVEKRGGTVTNNSV